MRWLLCVFWIVGCAHVEIPPVPPELGPDFDPDIAYRPPPKVTLDAGTGVASR